MNMETLAGEKYEQQYLLERQADHEVRDTLY